MKRFALYLGVAAVLVASCSIQEEDFIVPGQDDVEFYASFEQPAEEGTRVYANEDLLLRWTADDRVSIFNMNTYNQQYKFLGETGDNAGGFYRVDGADFVTGNPLSHVVSVYPYQGSTKISEDEVLTVTMPEKQTYAQNTFGLGDNTMVSFSSDNFLQYKNVGGYLMLSLYGKNAAVTSITLKGNNGEKIAGRGMISMHLSDTPSIVMASDAIEEITLTCDTPIVLGTTAEESTHFWFVVPPIEFTNGFTIVIDQTIGKSTQKSLRIERNRLTKMEPFEVVSSHPRNVIFYTSVDGQIIEPYSNDDFFGANLISNTYEDGVGVMTFDDDVLYIGNRAFSQNTRLTSMNVPESVTSIGYQAFASCDALVSFTVPKYVTYIGESAFRGCSSLTGITLLPETPPQLDDYAFQSSYDYPIYVPVESFDLYCMAQRYPSSRLVGIGVYSYIHYSSYDGKIVPTINANNAFVISNEYKNGEGIITYAGDLSYIARDAFRGDQNLISITIPDTVTRIEEAAFFICPNLSFIVIPQGVTKIGSCAFYECTSLKNLSIPESVTRIEDYAFSNCKALTSVTIPKSVTLLGDDAFTGCSNLSSIFLLSEKLPTQSSAYDYSPFDDTNDCPIYVPVHLVDLYKQDKYWQKYTDRIQPIPE